MADNSYAQLIDDYENGILVEPGETLTQYIDRMGGVDYKADGGSIGIEVLFEPKREEYQTGGRTFDSRATTQDYTNALQSVSAGTTGQQQADARRYARNQAAQMLNEAARAKPQARGIENIYNTFFKNQNVTGIGPNTFGRSGSGTNPDAMMYYRSADRDKILDAMANQMLNTTSYAPPTDSLTGMLESQMLPNMADGSMKSLAEQNAIRDRVLAAQKAQEESYYLTDPISGKKYTSQDEAINDLGLVTYNQRFADGGRVGLFMGGDPLTGQALSIYNSMNSYGFTDQQIADALSAQGLYGSGSTPASDTPLTNTTKNIINQGGDGGNNSNTLQSFRQDPSVMPAFEALQRNQQLTSMGINDPFANEASLSGAYYGDMPTDTSNQVGVYQPGIMENIKNKIGGTKIGSMFTGAVDQLTNNKFANTLGTALTFAKAPFMGGAKMLASGLNSILPTNQRAINENIAANLGIGVDNIGRIQGDYGTVGGVMSGYNLNQMDADTFDKRTDSITQTLTDKYGFTVEEIEDIIDGTYKGNKGFNKTMGKQTNLVRDLRNINLAKGIILNSKELGLKELERIEKEKALAAAQREIDKMGYIDYGSGGGRDESLNLGPGGSYTGKGDVGATTANQRGDFATDSLSYDLKDGGSVGLATMFKRKR